RRNKLRLVAFPRGRSSGHFLERGRLRSREGRRSWSLAIRDTRWRTWSIQAALGSLRHPFRPCEVRIDGRRLPPAFWRYEPKARVLGADFIVHRRARLSVTAC
ncbi:MAG: hypothetical protein ACJ75R_02900, partial [Solirubrobacterales bacterium]